MVANAPLYTLAFLVLFAISLAPVWRYIIAAGRAALGQFASWNALICYLYFGRVDARSTLTRQQRTSRIGINLFLNGVIYALILLVWAGYLRQR